MLIMNNSASKKQHQNQNDNHKLQHLLSFCQMCLNFEDCLLIVFRHFEDRLLISFSVESCWFRASIRSPPKRPTMQATQTASGRPKTLVRTLERAIGGDRMVAWILIIPCEPCGGPAKAGCRCPTALRVSPGEEEPMHQVHASAIKTMHI